MVDDGSILDPGTRRPLTTPPLGSTGVWIFAVREGRMRLAPDSGPRSSQGGLAPDAIKHETLFSNARVNAAGEVLIQQGVVVEVNAASGTYTCDMDDHFVGAVLEALRDAGARITEDLRRKLA